LTNGFLHWYEVKGTVKFKKAALGKEGNTAHVKLMGSTLMISATICSGNDLTLNIISIPINFPTRIPIIFFYTSTYDRTCDSVVVVEVVVGAFVVGAGP